MPIHPRGRVRLALALAAVDLALVACGSRHLLPQVTARVLELALVAGALADRLHPGESREDWRRAVIDRVGDERVVVDFHEEVQDEVEPVPVPWDTELYRVIEQVILDANEDAIVVPSMTVGGTDNRFLRARGIPAYGFAPCVLSKEERAGFHGNDEFITVENLQMGCELTYEITRRMCT